MKQVLIRFIGILLPLIAVVATASWYFYQQDVAQLQERVKEKERNYHSSLMQIHKLHFKSTIHDLTYLSGKIQQQYDDKLSIDEIRKTFKQLMINTPEYFSIALLDENGYPIIQANSPNSQENLPPQDVYRHYQTTINSIPKFSILVTPFLYYQDEILYNFITTINAKEHTSILLSYRLNTFLNDFSRDYSWTNGQNFILDENGILLMKAESELWPYSMTNDRFSASHRKEWNSIKNNNQGQFIIEDQLFTFTNFSLSNITASNSNIPSVNLPWITITKTNINQEVNHLLYSQQRIIKIIAFIFFIMSLFSACIVLAWHFSQQLFYEKKLRKERDNILDRYSSVIRNTADGLILINGKKQIKSLNYAACSIFNITTNSVGQSILSITTDKTVIAEILRLFDLVNKEQPNSKHTIFKSKTILNAISTRHIELMVSKIDSTNQDEFLFNIKDITYWVQRENKIRNLSQVIEQSDDGIVIITIGGLIEYVNKSFELSKNKRSYELVGTKAEVLLEPYNISDLELEQLHKKIQRGETVQYVVDYIDNNKTIYEHKKISPIKNSNGDITHYVSITRNITEQIIAENKLKKLAHYDERTNLPNRIHLVNKIANYIQSSENPAILLDIDLDNFKTVNETLGMECGDEILLVIAQRLQIFAQLGVIARVSGDEFTIFLTNLSLIPDFQRFCQQIHEYVSQPIQIRHKNISINISIGIARYPQDAITTDSLIKYANIALYEAKDRGRNRDCYFEMEMAERSTKRLELEMQLRESIGTDRYELFYQPKVDTCTHKLVGAEALLRWRDPYGKLASPIDVIPILELSGLIIPVGEQLITQACMTLKRWQDKGLQIHLALNLSAKQLQDSDIVETFERNIILTGCDPSLLQVELTESMLMADVKLALDTLTRLQTLGVKIAIDDFGTGYSSLAYLHKFPIHILKVDRSFVTDLPFCADSITISKAIVELAHSLNLQVVAEGVEDKHQAAFLNSINVDELQGFYFGKPMPIQDFETHFLCNSKNHSPCSESAKQ
ncbi:EAL domain-containing protein [Photobacterium damselae subsp. damselae]|nr:EAL domain-containing protein [Photobacterium damselae]KAB1519759.1 EAL domain-containing protein [Photobacterium damselae subsp. damselae]